MTANPYILVVKNGSLKGKKYPLPTTGLTLGRSSKCDIAIKDLLLSRTHCRFEMRADALWVVDLKSENQTLVNKIPVTEKQLEAGDLITVGENSLRVKCTQKPALLPALRNLFRNPAQFFKPKTTLAPTPTNTRHSSGHKFIPWLICAIAYLTWLLLTINLINHPHVKPWLQEQCSLLTTISTNAPAQPTPSAASSAEAPSTTNHVFALITNIITETSEDVPAMPVPTIQPTNQPAATPPAPLPASVLRIISTPLQASVSIQDEVLGTTPCELSNIMPGNYQVQLSKPDYEPITRMVTLEAGKTVVENFELLPTIGRIELVSAPANATVLLNGKKVGVTTVRDQQHVFSNILTMEKIPTGKHTIEVLHKGYTPGQRQVLVKKDEPLRLQFKLVRQFTPNYEVVTTRSHYKGILEFINEEGVRLETAGGVSQTILHKHIIRHGALPEPDENP